MKINSHDLANYSKELYDKIDNIVNRLKIYSEDELRKFGGSNMALAISGPEYSILLHIYEALSKKINISAESSFIEKYRSLQSELETNISTFLEEVDKIRSLEKGSIGKPYFYAGFSSYLGELISYSNELFNKLNEALQIKELLESKKDIESVREDIFKKNGKISELITEAENKSKEFLLKLEQSVNQKSVMDIKDFYIKYQKDSIIEKRIYGSFYGIFSFLFISGIIFLFYRLETSDDQISLWQKITLTFTIFAFISFLVNDFRKRFNISKNIIDDIKQKSAIVDIYSSLLTRIQDFDDATKLAYNTEILKNIISTLLSIKSNGYLGKEFNASTLISPSDLLDIVKRQIK